MNPAERTELATNIANHLKHAQDFIQKRAVRNFTQADPEYGRMVQEKLDECKQCKEVGYLVRIINGHILVDSWLSQIIKVAVIVSDSLTYCRLNITVKEESYKIGVQLGNEYTIALPSTPLGVTGLLHPLSFQWHVA